MIHQVCKRCGEDDPAAFMPSRHYICRPCHRTYQRALYHKDIEHSRFIRREWQSQPVQREKNKQKMAAWRASRRVIGDPRVPTRRQRPQASYGYGRSTSNPDGE